MSTLFAQQSNIIVIVTPNDSFQQRGFNPSEFIYHLPNSIQLHTNKEKIVLVGDIIKNQPGFAFKNNLS